MENTDSTCPSCGYCSHCGQSKNPPPALPINPWPWSPNVSPYTPYWPLPNIWYGPKSNTYTPNYTVMVAN